MKTTTILLSIIYCQQVLSIETSSINEIQGGTTTLTVGTDNSCDFNSIQAAIDAATGTATIIQISTQQDWNERLSIVNKAGLSINGGYLECTGQPTSAYSFIIGGSSIAAAPGIQITNSLQINLYGIWLKDAAYSGGIEIDNSQVAMEFIRLENNNHRTILTGLDGGGLYIFNNSDVSLSRGDIRSNQATRGGGIACLDSNVTINNTLIDNNIASNNNNTGKGGGIYVANGCNLNLNSFEAGPKTSVSYNSSDYQGGGMYIAGSSQILINHPNNSVFQNETPATAVFLDNKIISKANLDDSGGAGIAATGSGAIIEAYHLTLTNNVIESMTDDGGGGALLIKNNATFSMKVWKPMNNCTIRVGHDFRENNLCNQITNHTAYSGNKGAAVYANSGAQVDIYQTYITENMASNAHVAYIDDATLRMQGNIVVQNGNLLGGGELFFVTGSGAYFADFNTFTNNRLGSGLGAAYVVSTEAANFISFTRSIVDEHSNTSLYQDSSSTNSNFDCLLTHENSSFSGTNITLGSPTFQTTWPYHLAENSLGVDKCDESGALFTENDIDGQTRGFCTGGLACVLDPTKFDVGADEYHFDDVIFKNGFAPILKIEIGER